MAATAQPWERQPGERSVQWDAFVLYRDMGPADRSQKAVLALVPKSQRTIAYWSQANSWVHRAAAWDAEQDRVRRAKNIRAVIAMSERHAAIGMDLQEKAKEALDALTPEAWKAMSAWELQRFLEVGIRIEHMARGEHDPLAVINNTTVTANMTANLAAVPLLNILKARPDQIGPAVRLIQQLRDMYPNMGRPEIEEQLHAAIAVGPGAAMTVDNDDDEDEDDGEE